MQHSCRWQAEEEDHRHQLSSLRLAQEGVAERLNQEEDQRLAAEGEVARQKACICGVRADLAEFEQALQHAKAQVGSFAVFTSIALLQYLLIRSHVCECTH